ncbi:hypothetical protein C8R47DRAFT_1247232 [Mycena vitilis]|nr:hypothetical protein C8R47DRAFT_1247232 [Mycena vitilis]
MSSLPQAEADVATLPSASEVLHAHVLSTKSTELHATHFSSHQLAPSPPALYLVCATVLAHQRSRFIHFHFQGLNQKLTPISSAKLRRWAILLSGRKDLVFFICPVILKSMGAMRYSISPCGPIVDPTSTEPLPPGSRGLWLVRQSYEYLLNLCTKSHPFSAGELTDTGFEDLTGVDYDMRNKSFEFNVTYMEEPSLLDLYKFPPDIIQTVGVRDNQRCRVTGSTDDVMPTWIVPPPWAWAAVNINAGDPEDLDPAAFVVPANAFILRRDLKVHFYNHNFAVDVDDGYRIVVLRDMGADHALLPACLVRRPDDDGADAEFFRLHLRYSLNFMLLGGDIVETYPTHRILRMMEELGLGGDSEAEMAPLGDKRWDTELGKAILAEEMRVRTSLSLYYSGLEDSDNNSDEEPTTPHPEPIEEPADTPPWLSIKYIGMEGRLATDVV